MSFLFTSESVTGGHPDKMCDQISDALLDEALRQDPKSRVALETAVKTGMIFVFGEMRTNAWVDLEKIVRQVVHDIGYTRAKFGFDAKTASVISAIGNQSDEIHNGVDKSDEEIGAGDQGMMFGFACHETEHLMPLPITLAHALTKRLTVCRQEKICDFLRPDGKAQVTVEYDENEKPRRVHTVVVSAQHDANISQKEIQKEILEKVIRPVLGHWIDEKTIFHINPSGSFIVGGHQGDAGLTGRKIIVDTYGGSCPHGGGAFSGKDATKVDRSGAYAARHIAKNLVAAELAEKCEVQISYAIGIPEPVSILVKSFGTGKCSDRRLEEIVKKHWDLRPKKIINAFGLMNPIFQRTAVGGHFGNDEFPWEKLDRKEILQKEIL